MLLLHSMKMYVINSQYNTAKIFIILRLSVKSLSNTGSVSIFVKMNPFINIEYMIHILYFITAVKFSFVIV